MQQTRLPVTSVIAYFASHPEHIAIDPKYLSQKKSLSDAT